MLLSKMSSRKTIVKAWRKIMIGPLFVVLAEIALAVLLYRGLPASERMEAIIFAAAELVFVSLFSFAYLIAARPRENALSIAIGTTTMTFLCYVVALIPLEREDRYGIILIAYLVTLVANGAAALTMAKTSNLRVGLLSAGKTAQIIDLIGHDVIQIQDTREIGSLDILVVDFLVAHEPKQAEFIAKAFLSGIDVIHWTKFLELRKGRVVIEDFFPSQLNYTTYQKTYLYLKRVLDIACVVIFLPLTLLAVAAACAFVYLTDGGPVIFTQDRIGLGGRKFRLFKIRTMTNADSADAATVQNDQRIIRGGRFLRRYRIDELPQMFNVLIGDMSIIGCRPEADFLAERYEPLVPEYVYRHLVRPGISGWAQVKFRYVNTIDDVRIRTSYDLYYVKNISFELDLQIAIKTAFTLLLAKGAL